MRAAQFINEMGNVAPGIRDILEKQGYSLLGKGADQQAYLAPDGTILKIFGTSPSGSNEGKLTPAQNTFKIFADYCNEHSSNPFLPDFAGWETFRFEGMTYLQIRMERLFEFPEHAEWGKILEELANAASRSKEPISKERHTNNAMNNEWREDEFGPLLIQLGEEGFNQLWDTIYELTQLARQHGFQMDLHEGNFMLGSDGQVVISDPFFIGWGKGSQI
jgi:hypothetical protein